MTQEQKLLGIASLIGIFGIGTIHLRAVIDATKSLLGFRLKTDSPRIRIAGSWLSDSARLRHTHIVGATGTGKTVLLEHLLFKDLSRGYGAIIIDPKGERSFYESVRSYCRRIGRENDLILLSASTPQESARWNPCELGSSSELQTKFFNSSIYNEPHYAKACEFGLLQAFRRLCSKSAKFNISDLIRELKTISQDDRQETLKGLYFDLSNLMLGEWSEILCCTPNPDDPRLVVSLLDVIRNDKILFVDLPTEGKKVQSGRIGRLLTQEIILVSGMRKRNPALKGARPFSVFIDEFDAFATESFSSFLNKGRSSDFMIHLAHQTLSDLNCISPEFTGQIMGNCNVRFIFRQDDPNDAETWSRFIGTKLVKKATYRTKDGDRTGEASIRDTLEFVIAPDAIKSLPIGRCIFSIKTEGRSARIIEIPFRRSRSVTQRPTTEPIGSTAYQRPLEIPVNQTPNPVSELRKIYSGQNAMCGPERAKSRASAPKPKHVTEGSADEVSRPKIHNSL